jgi:hypothetical protein
MTQSNDNIGQQTRLSVTELFAQHLQKQIDAHAAGLGHAEPVGDVLPHEAVPVQPVDPALAWKDAIACPKILLGRDAAQMSFDVPPEWPALVARQEPAVALAFALGNFPQLVRNLQPLLSGQMIALRDGPREAVACSLPGWASEAKDEPARLLAAGVLRLARHFDAAARCLDFTPSAQWAALHANESAALAWHRGEAEKALAMWQSQPDSAATLFNRGMANLFLGDNEAAQRSLSAAAAQLPENGAWHHLAQLYLAILRSRA